MLGLCSPASQPQRPLSSHRFSQVATGDVGHLDGQRCRLLLVSSLRRCPSLLLPGTPQPSYGWPQVPQSTCYFLQVVPASTNTGDTSPAFWLPQGSPLPTDLPSEWTSIHHRWGCLGNCQSCCRVRCFCAGSVHCSGCHAVVAVGRLP
jgi:hypothetical protein